MAFELDQLYGQFLPTTRKFSEEKVRELSVSSPEFKEFLVDLLQALNDISIQTNEKDFGRYPLQEIINGQLFFPDPTITPSASNVQTPDYRQVFRTVVNFGALPNGTSSTTKQVAHNIDITSSTVGTDNPVTFTRIYGVANRPSTTTSLSYLPLPYVSHTAADQIQIDVDATNVTITVDGTKNYSDYTKTYIILEYIRN